MTSLERAEAWIAGVTDPVDEDRAALAIGCLPTSLMGAALRGLDVGPLIQAARIALYRRVNVAGDPLCEAARGAIATIDALDAALGAIREEARREEALARPEVKALLATLAAAGRPLRSSELGWKSTDLLALEEVELISSMTRSGPTGTWLYWFPVPLRG